MEGRWVFEVANRGAVNVYEKACLDWYAYQTFSASLFPASFELGSSHPCPCNYQTAEIDERFIIDTNTKCAYSLTRDSTTQLYQVRLRPLLGLFMFFVDNQYSFMKLEFITPDIFSVGLASSLPNKNILSV